ncbi:MAG: TerB family tellurite resistance protein [Bdellovibrionota bacterium]
MIIIFKLLGAFVGLRTAAFFGGSPMMGIIIGGLLGHSADIVVSTKIQRAKARRYYQAQANAHFGKMFVGTLFTMLGKLCAADGEINAQETERVQKLINEGIKLNRRERKEALQVFRQANRVATSFQFDAAQYYELYQNDQQSLQNLIVLLFDVALADGPLKPNEEKLIRSVAVLFNLPDEVWNQIRGNFVRGNGSSSQRTQAGSSLTGEPDDPYTVLGCKRTDPEKVIKQNYRKLVSDYHPDKIVSKNLPEEFTKFANEKFKSIQEAYELVKSERGFN